MYTKMYSFKENPAWWKIYLRYIS